MISGSGGGGFSSFLACGHGKGLPWI